MCPVLQRICLCLSAMLVLAGNAGAAKAGSGREAMDGVWLIERPRASLRGPGDPPIPFTPAGRERYEHNAAAEASGDYGFDPTQSFCASPGAPRIMLTPKPFKLFVRKDVVSMMFAWNRLLRQIDMHGPVRIPDVENEFGVASMMGKSWGLWQGDTLLIESHGFLRERLLDDLIPNSEKLRLDERLRLIDENTLEDRITITDPEIFTQPWEVTLRYRRLPSQTFAEDVCLDRKAAGQWPLPTARGKYTPQEAANLKIVVSYFAALDRLDTLEEKAYREELPIVLARHVREDYIQHNAAFARYGQGSAGLSALFLSRFDPANAFMRNAPPGKVRVLAVMADGDKVVRINTRKVPGQPPIYIYNLFRVQDGLIAEHWDGM